MGLSGSCHALTPWRYYMEIVILIHAMEREFMEPEEIRKDMNFKALAKG